MYRRFNSLSFLGPTGTGSVELLPESDFTTALNQFVEKEDKVAISDFVQKKLQSTQKYLEQQDPTKTKSTESIQHLVIEQTMKQQAIDNLKRQEIQRIVNNSVLDEDKKDEVKNEEKDKDLVKNTKNKNNTIKKKKDEDEPIILDDDMFNFDADAVETQTDKGKKAVKTKKEKKTKSSQASQSRKRSRTVDDFVAPTAPAPKKAKTTANAIPKIEPDVSKKSTFGPTAKQAAIFDIIDGKDEDNESTDTSTLQTKKWGSRKKSL